MRTIYGVTIMIAILLGTIFFPAGSYAAGRLREVFLASPTRVTRVGGYPLTLAATVIVQVDEKQAVECEQKLGRPLTSEELVQLAYPIVSQPAARTVKTSKLNLLSENGAQSIFERLKERKRNSGTARLNNQLNESCFFFLVGSVIEMLGIAWGVATIALGVIAQVNRKEEIFRLVAGFVSIMFGLCAPALCHFIDTLLRQGGI